MVWGVWVCVFCLWGVCASCWRKWVVVSCCLCLRAVGGVGGVCLRVVGGVCGLVVWLLRVVWVWGLLLGCGLPVWLGGVGVPVSGSARVGFCPLMGLVPCPRPRL